MKIAVLALVALLTVGALAACDPWGARKCGIDHLACSKGLNSSICECYEAMGHCLEKFDCYSNGPYYMYHYSCLSAGCNTTYCNGSSAAQWSVLAALGAAIAQFLVRF
eukprot:m51a1_g3280 hypothetical protein (108) ;mRNA; r:254892-255601